MELSDSPEFVGNEVKLTEGGESHHPSPTARRDASKVQRSIAVLSAGCFSIVLLFFPVPLSFFSSMIFTNVVFLFCDHIVVVEANGNVLKTQLQKGNLCINNKDNQNFYACHSFAFTLFMPPNTNNVLYLILM